MSIDEVHQELTRSAVFLRNAAPDEFMVFIRNFRAIVNVLTVAVTRSPAGEVLIDQGKAQQAQRFLEVLTNEAPQP